MLYRPSAKELEGFRHRHRHRHRRLRLHPRLGWLEGLGCGMLKKWRLHCKLQSKLQQLQPKRRRTHGLQRTRPRQPRSACGASSANSAAVR